MDALWCEALASKVNADERLVWRGRHASTSFLLQVDQAEYVIQILAGRVAAVKRVLSPLPTGSLPCGQAKPPGLSSCNLFPSPAFMT